MPELPEVEIVRRGVSAVCDGRRLTGVTIREPRLRWPVPDALFESIGPAVLRQTRRRSKYLLLEFDSGTLLVHLGMSGTLRHHAAAPAPGLHDHVDLCFDGGTLRYNDPRRFGSIHWWPDSADSALALHPLLAGLGVEPFSPQFDALRLRDGFSGRSSSIKQMLLSGAVVVGVGNIYACESLFRAGIRPTLAAGRVSLPRLERLVVAIREVLQAAIAAGGSTLHDFVGSDGAGGCFQVQTQVYGREGLPCLHCATPIRRIVQQQRSTWFCPACQRR